LAVSASVGTAGVKDFRKFEKELFIETGNIRQSSPTVWNLSGSSRFDAGFAQKMTMVRIGTPRFRPTACPDRDARFQR